MSVDTWFLGPDERGNAATELDRRRVQGGSPGAGSGTDAAGTAWSTGNLVLPLVHGATYFRRLCAELRACGAGDQVYLVDWRGDPDERLDGPGSAIAVELARAASAGAEVKGLVWRSHLDRFRMSEKENRTIVEAVSAVGGELLLDQRVRRGGSHHQKFVVVRHPSRPGDDVAFVGGIDLGHSRRDDAEHRGDPQPQQMNPAYGPRPPWHDVQLEIHGPAVADVEWCFRERWSDPTSLEHLRPWLELVDHLRGLDERPDRLPRELPPPPSCGPHAVQLLRTYPKRRPAYPFAPDGERSVARGYLNAIAHAQRLVYVEDQFLWSTDVARHFADALRRNRGLRLTAVVPRHTDVAGGMQQAAEHHLQREALTLLYEAGGDRVQVYDLENAAGTPVYVHAKVCIVDDTWAAVGSANLNRRSWSHDSELTAAVLDDEGRFARDLRLQLWAEHVGRDPDDCADLADPVAGAQQLRRSAETLDAWYAGGRRGARPAGQLRPHGVPVVELRARPMVPAFARAVSDPDGRPRALQARGEW